MHAAMGFVQESFKIVMRCHQFPSEFLTKGHLSQMSHRSANDKGDNEMIPAAVHRSPDTCLADEENSGKPQLGDRLKKGLCDQTSLQMGSLTSR